MKQTFKVGWHGERIAPERIRTLVNEHAKLYYTASSCNVWETTQQPNTKDNDRYHVVMTPAYPMEAGRLNEIAAEGWRLRGIVRRRDTSVARYRELFYHYFEWGEAKEAVSRNCRYWCRACGKHFVSNEIRCRYCGSGNVSAHVR